MKRKNFVSYLPELKQRARDLRKNSTFSEVLLWNRLKGRQIRGYQFLRQKPLKSFIVDFFCYDLMLALEVDGASHVGKDRKDFERQKALEEIGVRFLRVTDHEVKEDLEGVVRQIDLFIRQLESEKET